MFFQMRVIAGKCRGRRLSGFAGLSIRPTSDKVREAVFNILPRDFSFKKVIDLFAGTGAMGIEALSRGSEEAVFVEIDSKAVSVIKKNIEACGLENAVILKKDVLGSIRFFSRKGTGFDLIIVDPPYDTSLFEETIKAVDKARLLNSSGVLVAETSRRAPLKAGLENLEVMDERKYGDTLVYFLKPRLKDDED
ncbi:MAG: 16S rRNA (guanine(966)-N(2))-methyltransferase RsmD [Deltaproteobacteria bacterium]